MNQLETEREYRLGQDIYVLSPDRRNLIKVASGDGKRKNWRESTTYTDDKGRSWEFNTTTRRWGLHSDHKKSKKKKADAIADRKTQFRQYLDNPDDPDLKQLFEEIHDASDRYDAASSKAHELIDEIKSEADSIDRVINESQPETENELAAAQDDPLSAAAQDDRRIEELSDSLLDGDWSDLMRHLDEISEIYDRKFQRPPYVDSDAAPIVKSFEIDFQALNNILPFDLISQRQVKQVLDEIDTELRSLTELSAEARAEYAFRGLMDTIGKIFDEVKDGLAEASPILDKLTQEKRSQFDRLYAGRLDRSGARRAALNKRVFETLNPRKLVRVPPGTTPIEYAAIVDRLVRGDKQAIKEFTIRKPAKKRQPRPRKRKR